MLPKENRLKKRNDFKKIHQQGKSILKGKLILRFLPAEGRNLIGIIVSKKVSKKAVVRNKIKRRIRSILRDNIEKIPKGYNIIFIALSGIDKMDFSQIKSNTIFLLEKIKDLP